MPVKSLFDSARESSRTFYASVLRGEVSDANVRGYLRMTSQIEDIWTQEYNRWAYSACSAAAMTEVINAYGHHYRVTDILKVESQIGEITPELGLMEEVGIERTAARFGFKTVWGHKLSLDDIIDVANHGRPVIVDWPPARYAGGHLLVVTGGNSNYVYMADSSLYNRHSLTRNQFLNWWEGFAAIVTPD